VFIHMSYLEHETWKWKGCHLDKKHVINEGFIWDFESVESTIDQPRIWVACSLKVEIQASLVVANNSTSKTYLPSIVKLLVTLQKYQKHKPYTFYFIINHARARFISKLSIHMWNDPNSITKNIYKYVDRVTHSHAFEIWFTQSQK
jgi:hypothetical protein